MDVEALTPPLGGRTALVTGGSRGIGRGIALALARAGADVGVTFHTREAAAAETVDALRKADVRALAVRMDAARPDDVTRAFQAVRAALGPVHVLVNNAAMAQEKDFAALDVEDWDRMLATNLRGPALCCRAALPDMCAAGFGRIVNVASVGGQWGGTRQVHYAVSKAGLIGLTRSLAKCWADRGITVNAVSPGLVETDMTRAELASDEGRAKLAAIPLARTGEVAEVAAAVVYLASPGAAYVTGQILNVNGGMYSG